jgi:hypothetical protein
MLAQQCLHAGGWWDLTVHACKRKDLDGSWTMHACSAAILLQSLSAPATVQYSAVSQTDPGWIRSASEQLVEEQRC